MLKEQHRALLHSRPDEEISISRKETSYDCSQTILVDNNVRHVYFGQEKNALVMYPLDYEDFITANRANSCSVGDYFWDAYQTELYQAFNHVFYLVGMLETILANAISKNTKLSNELFNLQYKPKAIQGDCFELDISRYKCESYYSIGLKKLQQFNPNLEFYFEKPNLSATATLGFINHKREQHTKISEFEGQPLNTAGSNCP